MSSLQPNLVRFFENLPLVPLTQVINHFEDSDLIKLSVLSPNFHEAISPRRINGCSVLQLDIAKSEINIEIIPLDVELIKKGKLKEKIVIRYINDDSDKESIDNDKIIWIHRKDWKTQGNRLILETSQLISDKFSIPFRSSGTEDSLWMTGADLLKVNCTRKHFGANQFTDKNFNAFLHSWMAGNNDNMQHYSFQVDKDLKIEEVIRGLITEKWDPAKRDQKFITYSPTGVVLPLIDMADGYDIPRTGKRLGTVLITDNTLHIVTWIDLRRIKWMDWYQYGQVTFYNRRLRDQTIGSEYRQFCEKTRAEALESLRNVREDPTLEVDGFEFREDFDLDKDV